MLWKSGQNFGPVPQAQPLGTRGEPQRGQGHRDQTRALDFCHSLYNRQGIRLGLQSTKRLSQYSNNSIPVLLSYRSSIQQYRQVPFRAPNVGKTASWRVFKRGQKLCHSIGTIGGCSGDSWVFLPRENNNKWTTGYCKIMSSSRALFEGRTTEE